jgi:hypothetical protein
MPSAAARFARRLAAQFDAQCWTGLIVRIVPAGTRGDDRAAAPAHFLGAAWAPAAAGPARWPEAVVIGAPDADAALAELMRHVPAAARLYLADRDAVDAGLAAEILLASDRNLEPYQRAALAAFIAAERNRVTAAIATRYSDRDPAFLRFRARVVDGG